MPESPTLARALTLFRVSTSPVAQWRNTVADTGAEAWGLGLRGVSLGPRVLRHEARDPRPEARELRGADAYTVADSGAVPCVDIYTGERLGMGSTAMGRELDVWGRKETGERDPIASTPVACRSPVAQWRNTVAGTEAETSGLESGAVRRESEVSCPEARDPGPEARGPRST